uniref:Uncharacterized protein n=1 Tax=Varanus komodoensis TaxID=61221 RepID=A0A8D2KZV0_VARKO
RGRKWKGPGMSVGQGEEVRRGERKMDRLVACWSLSFSWSAFETGPRESRAPRAAFSLPARQLPWAGKLLTDSPEEDGASASAPARPFP